MDAADQPAKADVVHDEQNALVGLFGRWLVVQGEQNAGDALDEKQGKGNPTQAKVPADGVLGYRLLQKGFAGGCGRRNVRRTNPPPVSTTWREIVLPLALPSFHKDLVPLNLDPIGVQAEQVAGQRSQRRWC